eukprot:557275-Amphidinium_carterae.1
MLVSNLVSQLRFLQTSENRTDSWWSVLWHMPEYSRAAPWRATKHPDFKVCNVYKFQRVVQHI